MRIFLFFTFILIQSGCATIEVAKEITKATNSIQNSIKKIAPESKEGQLKESIPVEEQLKESILVEKKQIVEEKKEEEVVVLKQKKISTILLIGKTLNELKLEFGEPHLVRVDGNTKTVRFDTNNCRIFIYFNNSKNESPAEYYELRNVLGKLVEESKDIEECFVEFKLV